MGMRSVWTPSPPVGGVNDVVSILMEHRPECTGAFGSTSVHTRVTIPGSRDVEFQEAAGCVASPAVSKPGLPRMLDSSDASPFLATQVTAQSVLLYTPPTQLGGFSLGSALTHPVES